MTHAITPPAVARRVFPWEFDGDGWSRWFDGSTCNVGPATITVAGRQYEDGTALRGVAGVLGDGELLDADEAARLAVMLLGVAGELERIER